MTMTIHREVGTSVSLAITEYTFFPSTFLGKHSAVQQNTWCISLCFSRTTCW